MKRQGGEGTLYVVHCVDTEGPLAEGLEATFERLRSIFGVELAASEENLGKLQRGEIDLGERTAAVRRLLAPQLQGYNRNWAEVDAMLARVTSPCFRERRPDSAGCGWVYSWFCLDHVGYQINPRQRDLGHHKVWDHYRELLQRPENRGDRTFFHYHPLPYNRMAHSCATWYLNQNHLFEILARKVIERQSFPTVFRPGFHVTRPDSNLFLEQWIPFDFANQATEAEEDQPDLTGGRFGDWRRAPRTWGGYHPSHDDYQTPGACRRWIFRCLNLEARLRRLTPEDVEQAFAQAGQEGSAVLAFTNHDFRNMEPEVAAVREMIAAAAARRPGVRFRYVDALTAVRRHLGFTSVPPLGLKVALSRSPSGSMELSIRSDAQLFGPQPFLALRDTEGGYFYDNLDFGLDGTSWHYTFDWQTFLPERIESIGVAAPGAQGQVELALIRPGSGEISSTRLNFD